MSAGYILVFVLMICTVIALSLGFVVMLKGGKINEKYSGKLMFARVAFQGGAILLLAVLALFAAK